MFVSRFRNFNQTFLHHPEAFLSQKQQSSIKPGPF